MRAALRLTAFAVGLATVGAAADDVKQPRLASIGGTAQNERNDASAAAKLCANFSEEINATDRSHSNTIGEPSQSGWRADDKMIAQCQAAADHGDAAASYALGVMYGKGLGVQPDLAQAATWFRKSADLGLAKAQVSVAAMYADGEGVPQSRAEAIKWLRMAADQGDALAQYNLGLMYCDGHGDPQDLVQAHMWLNLAAARGLRQAGSARDQVAAWIGSSAEVAKAQQLAVEQGAAAGRLAAEYQPRP